MGYRGEKYSPGGILVLGHFAYSRYNGNWLADVRTSQTGRYFEEKLLQALGLDLTDVAFTNSFKCLTETGMSPPEPKALEYCAKAHLPEEIGKIAPGKIVAWGPPVSENLSRLSGAQARNLDLAGTLSQYGSIPVFEMYHPCYQVRFDPEGEKVLPAFGRFLEAP